MNKVTLSTKRKPRFKREHIIRLDRLLNMQYTPKEIAYEIGVSVDTVYRSYLPAGCSAELDKDGRIWIVGVKFRDWVRAILSQNNRATKNPECSKPDRAWCFRCAQCVKIRHTRIRPVNYYLELLQGECEQCGGQVNRARAAAKREVRA